MITFVKNRIAAIGALFTLLALVYFRETIVAAIVAQNISLNGMYGAIFDWSAIQTGFLFGAFGFIAGKKDGFVGAIAGTKAMESFSWSLIKAISAGFLLTFSSMILIVLPQNPQNFGIQYILVSLWFCLFIWAFLLFCIVAYNFGIIIRVRDSDERLAH